MNYLSLWALAAGAAIATQVGMNARLGVLLNNPLIGTAIAFTSSALFTMIAVIASTREYPRGEILAGVPTYLWFSGGIFSAFGVALFYYLTPRMGVGPMMSCALTGQVLVAVVSSHFGWYDLPVKPVTVVRLAGITAMIIGILLINRE